MKKLHYDREIDLMFAERILNQAYIDKDRETATEWYNLLVKYNKATSKHKKWYKRTIYPQWLYILIRLIERVTDKLRRILN